MSTTPVSLHANPRQPHHNGARIKHFLHPDGRRLHIASTPEEAERLRHTLSREKPDQEFELYVHGSPEHVEAMRQIHAHHESKRDKLRRTHSGVYDEFEKVRDELDAISTELHMLTEHAVSLDANFSKYGYSAHLRTREPATGASVPHGGHSSSHEPTDWDAERQKGRVTKLWSRPIVRQYFHKGLLWRASDVEEVASFELFVDLLYVGIIQIAGDSAAENPSGFALLKFSITFILSWKLWSDLTLTISWFETDDILQRVCVLFITACLFGYTTNIVYSFDTTYTQLIAFYLAARFFSAVYYLWVAYLVPMVRGTMIGTVIMIFIPASLWIGSIYVDYPARLGLIIPAITLDLFGSLFLVFIMRGQTRFLNELRSKVAQYLEFYPAVNIEHKTERTNAFITLVIGYSVVALIYQNKSTLSLNAYFGKAILGLVQAFCFNWLYFEIDGDNLHMHAIRRHVKTSLIWTTMHLPFVMSFVLAGATLSRLVLARDCGNTDVESLAEAYVSKSAAELEQGLRWFYCAGLGISLAAMGVISLCHVHKKIEGARIRKRQRLIVRFAVAVILVCLPLAQGLDSLQLIATTTCLIVFVLVVDLYGSTCVGDSMWRSNRRTCKYSATMQGKDVALAAKAGGIVNVEELAGQESGEKGFLELS